jgi:hypothetical protein
VVVAEETELEESQDTGSNAVRNEFGESPTQAQYRAWWTPVIDAPLDDPDQEPPKLYWPNNIRLPLPWPTKIWATAFRYGGDAGFIGVGLNGQEPGFSEAMSALERQKDSILAELPESTVFRTFDAGKRITITTQRKASAFTTDDEMRHWLASTLNSYVNALRPRLKALMKERHADLGG